MGAFVIPSADLGDRRKVRISAPVPWAYAGRWARYLDAWEQAAIILEKMEQ